MRKTLNTILLISLLLCHSLLFVNNDVYLEYENLSNKVIDNSTDLEPKVLIIGIDGVRADVAESSAEREGSAFGELKENGSWSFNSTVGPISISGPSWSSMLTGVWCDRHGVVDNSFEGSNHSTVKNIFEMIDDENSELKTAAILYWSGIDNNILGEKSADIQERYDTDIEIKNRTIELINNDTELDLLFLNIDNPDSNGHQYGFSPNVTEYVDAVEQADDMAAEILSALDQRNKSGEDWLVIITSDHGGGGVRPHAHSPSSLIDRTTFMLAIGENTLSGEMTTNPVVVDVTVSALIHLGITLPEGSEELDGRAVLFDSTILDAREANCIRPSSEYEEKMEYVNLAGNILMVTLVSLVAIYVGKKHLKK